MERRTRHVVATALAGMGMLGLIGNLYACQTRAPQPAPPPLVSTPPWNPDTGEAPPPAGAAAARVRHKQTISSVPEPVAQSEEVWVIAKPALGSPAARATAGEPDELVVTEGVRYSTIVE